MSDRDAENGHSARLLRTLIWAGVGLAPVAALVVLLGGSDGSVRLAVLLIAACVVLIGASMLIRSDPVLLRMDVEDRVAAELDALRDEMRDELRGELAAARAAVAAPARREPGLTTGGRAAVRASAGVPGGRAAVPPPMPGPMPGHVPGHAPGPIPGQVPGQRGRGSASVPPPIAPVFRPPSPAHAPDPIGPPPEGYEGGGGRRRADITAVDFGYTGRRSRPAHSDLEQGHSQGDYEYDDAPDPLAEQYDWRSRGRSGNW
jgi:hypothetical protein